MYVLMIIVFVVGYTFIALEHSVRIDKAASAILTGVICWTILTLGSSAIFPDMPVSETLHFLNDSLSEHVDEIASILFFLLGAMTIVELIDAHEGFRVITDKLSTTNKVKLMWLVCILTFFLSALLDNLTTSIVMAALLRKLMKDQEDLWLFAGMVVISANAGGAWSPIGDVTTIMLWIGKQITAMNIIGTLFIPSVVCMLVPLGYLSFTLKGDVSRPTLVPDLDNQVRSTSLFERIFVLTLGVAGLLFVPVFKTLTHLPPYMGMMLSLSILWIITEILHRREKQEEKFAKSVVGILGKVDVPTIFFFLGILLAVASLQTAGHLAQMATVLDNTFGDIYIVNTIIGALSAIVDNVPLVAGAMGMYSMDTFAQDHTFWELLAYCAGTGGSMLIIGSAAGVAVMGILKIDFIWYVKRISLLAASGYLAGILTYYVMFG